MDIENKIAIIIINNEGLKKARIIKMELKNADIFLKSKGLIEFVGNIFYRYKAIVFIMAVGIVVRSIAKYIKNKFTDPAIVVVDDKARYSISLLSGHEGGANRLANKIANILGAESIVTTASDTNKNIIVGIGCRRDTKKEKLRNALENSLKKVNLKLNDIRCLATIDIKRKEKGIRELADELGLQIFFAESLKINLIKNLEKSKFVEDKIGVYGVCEPSCLLAGRKVKLILRKTKFNGITIAIGKEDEG